MHQASDSTPSEQPSRKDPGPERRPPRLTVLGPVTVHDRAGTPLSTVPKPRQLLAVLALEAGLVVSIQSLVRELWDDRPPRTATTTLQTYVGQARKLLAEATGADVHTVSEQMLITEDGGYSLLLDELSLDLADYDQLDRLGTTAVRVGDDARGSGLLGEALDLWRGPALVNVDPGPVLAAQVSRLEERRLSTLEHRIVADLRLGAHHMLVGELVELTARYPLHETLHGHRMLALYRCGRRCEGMEVFRDLRRRLVRELGIEPAADLAALHQSILTADPALDLSRPDDGLARLRVS